MANDVLRRERSKWRASPERGKILVCLAYVIGASMLHEKADLSWKIDYGQGKYGSGYLAEISIGNDSQIMEIFSHIANFDAGYYILAEHGIDSHFWKILLKLHEAKSPSAKPPAVDIIIREK
jgi:hypothetical protein